MELRDVLDKNIIRIDLDANSKEDALKKMSNAIATLKENIEWETLDGDKVKTIFLFCVSNDVNFSKNHLSLLSKVAGKLADDELLLRINTAKSADDIVNCLSGNPGESFCAS